MLRPAGKLLGGFGQGLSDFKTAFKDAYGEGREEWARANREARKALNMPEDAPRGSDMFGSYPLGIRTKELVQDIRNKKLSPEDKARRLVRQDAGLGAKQGFAPRAGQMLGTLGADMTQDVSRSIYWLLNAPQATANVIAESSLGAANPKLYGRSPVEGGKYNFKQAYAIPSEYVTNTGTRVIPKKGYRFDEDGVLFKRNFEPGDVASLLIPTGIAVNTGLGLLSPFGGTNGFKAAIPSEEDPTVTENVLGEIASKYFLGRTGNLLPYNEFSKVRPDVSPEEYAAYQAFKYDNSGRVDLNKGEVSVPSGILKYTNEGIFGPEVQFLGRSLPATTALVPFLGALGGGVAGVRTSRPIKGGLVGGLGGLAVGQVAGNLIEAERRRRNQLENESQLNQY